MWTGTRVLITGANGFLGSHLVRKLLDLGALVTALVRPQADPWRLAGVLERLSTVRAELRQLQQPEVMQAIGAVDVVFHLAAAGTDQSQHDAELMLETNVLGTYQALSLARQFAVGRFVHVGTGLEYGIASKATEDALPRPLTAYAASKAAAWLFAHTFAQGASVPIVSLRIFSIYGPSQADCFLVPFVIRRALANLPIPITGGVQRRDFAFVDDAVDALLRAATAADAVGETLNVSSGAEITVADITSQIVRIAESRSEVLIAAKPYSANELWVSTGNPERADRVLGWRVQTPLEEGVRRTIHWFRENLAQYESRYPLRA